MKNALKFDPCRPARRLIEMLVDNGLTAEALPLTQSVDEAQLRLWQSSEAREPALTRAACSDRV